MATGGDMAMNYPKLFKDSLMRNLYLLFMVLAPLLSVAQPMLEGGLFLGISNYQGDLALVSTPRMSESNFATGLMARTYLSPVTALRANLLYGKLSGDDANYRTRTYRSYSFESRLLELSVVGEWEPLGGDRHQNNLDFAGRMSPYLFGGLGLALINPKVDFHSDSNEKAVEDQLADYSKAQFSIPLGVGLKIGINRLWGFGLELGTRATFTDYLDGVSRSGNPGANDWYLFGGGLVTYRFK